jgi:DNA polymerase-3 subunit gamma/tau
LREAGAACTMVTSRPSVARPPGHAASRTADAREPGAPTLKSVADVKKAELEVGVRADPLVKAVLERFPGAEIVGVRGAKDAAPELPTTAEPEIPLPDDIGFGDNWERDE